MSEPSSHLALPPRFFGVSLKMYFGHVQTLNWCERVATLARRSPALVGGRVALVVLPTFTALTEAVSIFAGTNVQVGAQDLFWHDQGAFTGEVGGPELNEIGCCFVEVGHAERRGLRGESDSVVARKVAAVVRNDMTPILCVGEPEPSSAGQAAAWCTSQMDMAIGPESELGAPPAKGVVVAYEPIWAIGASAPAPADHIVSVCVAIRRWLTASSLRTSRLIYGGSARAGLFSQLDGCTDGLFLGRSVHDPDNLEKILAEAS